MNNKCFEILLRNIILTTTICSTTIKQLPLYRNENANNLLMGETMVVLDCVMFIHKIRITLWGASRPWRDSKFHVIKFSPGMILVECPV